MNIQQLTEKINQEIERLSHGPTGADEEYEALEMFISDWIDLQPNYRFVDSQLHGKIVKCIYDDLIESGDFIESIDFNQLVAAITTGVKCTCCRKQTTKYSQIQQYIFCDDCFASVTFH